MSRWRFAGGSAAMRGARWDATGCFAGGSGGMRCSERACDMHVAHGSVMYLKPPAFSLGGLLRAGVPGLVSRDRVGHPRATHFDRHASAARLA